MKYTLLVFLLALSGLCSAQDTAPTLKQAKNAFDNATEVHNRKFIESETLYNDFAGKDIGDIVVKGNDIYKLYNRDDIPIYCYGILYLDYDLLSEEEINTETKKIMADYRSGIPFETIIDRYYPGEGAANARKQFAPEVISEELVAAYDSNKPGDIFAVRGEESWLIVVKNSEPYVLKAIGVMHIEYSKE